VDEREEVDPQISQIDADMQAESSKLKGERN